VGDLPVFDYVLYPLENTVIDKICATMQTYPNGRKSSHVKDLVDLAIILSGHSFGAGSMSEKLACELAVRKIEPQILFEVPEEWLTSLAPSYAKMAKEARIPEYLSDSSSAAKVVSRFTNRLLANETDAATWNPMTLCWEEARK
jgi:hypothetical protein